MAPTTVLIFICGCAVGFASAFILMTLVSARRRRRHFGVPNSYGMERHLDAMASAQADRLRRNDEPTELDQ